jgi:hypothetical protein
LLYQNIKKLQKNWQLRKSEEDTNFACVTSFSNGSLEQFKSFLVILNTTQVLYNKHSGRKWDSKLATNNFNKITFCSEKVT